VSLDAVAVPDTTGEDPFDVTVGDVTGDGPPGSDVDDGSRGDAAADSGIDATLDSGSDATPDSQGDAPPEDAASDALPVVDAAEAGDASAPDGGCSPVGSYRCAADGHPQYCQADGLWGAEDCNYSCAACGGLVRSADCSNWCTTPGATTCAGNAVQTCGPSHHWGTAVACDSGACAGGACSGTCTPGAVQCSGNGVQTCSPSGTWGTPVECTGQTCVAGVCTGVCSPFQIRNVVCGNCGTNVQTCGGGGVWQGGTCVGEGACAAGATRSCGPSGASQTCTTACQWGGCSCTSNCGCTQGATQCAGNRVQTCDDAGAWSAQVGCAASTPFCVGGACVSSPPAQSCAGPGPGLTDCGSGGDAGGESCCTTLAVPAGFYYRSYSNVGFGPSNETDPATVSDFKLDKYLVTVGRFRQFVSAWNVGTGFTPPAGSGKHTHLNGGLGLVNAGAPADAGTVYETGWVASDNASIAPTDENLDFCGINSTWTSTPGSQESLPIDCLNWYEAYAFCIWDGGFLPSEAEWEYAAAGGEPEREYPWGSTAPGTANHYAIYGDALGDCYYPSGTLAVCTGVANIAPVGTATLGAGRWGQLDLAGEVWQWALDWYSSSYDNPCIDCANLTSPYPPSVPAACGTRVARSTSYADQGADLVSTFRTVGFSPAARSSVGFRCARAP
jgi:formylglycine-generating enzyme required for sulfatase activity